MYIYVPGGAEVTRCLLSAVRFIITKTAQQQQQQQQQNEYHSPKKWVKATNTKTMQAHNPASCQTGSMVSRYTGWKGLACSWMPPGCLCNTPIFRDRRKYRRSTGILLRDRMTLSLSTAGVRLPHSRPALSAKRLHSHRGHHVFRRSG